MASAPAFPGYRVLGALGQGGMGQVYLAEDEVLGRRVAIKTIRGDVSGEGPGRARFLREARVMATVEHARVVRVYSFGETAGKTYLVMELVDGETLAAYLERRRRIGVDEALRITREVAEALSAAWGRGIVHRDIKPSNIILDREGHVHVADFGLARPMRAGRDPSITSEGVFVGSPHYVAPEQARNEEMDFRTDVYALGVVLFQMLTGRRPFEGGSAMEIVSKHLHEPLPSLDELAPGSGELVRRLVRTMTEKRPELRPDSYVALMAALAAASAASPPEPATPGPALPTATMPTATGIGRAAPMGRPGLSRQLRLGAAAVVATVWIGYGLRDRLVRPARPPGELVVAIAPFQPADEPSREEARVLTSLVEGEVERLLGTEDGRAVGLTSLAEPAGSTREARRLGHRAGADVVLWGEVIAFRGDVQLRSALTLVAEDDTRAPPRLETQLLGQQAGTPIELRRDAATELAEAIARLAARDALDRGRGEQALALIAECRPTEAVLELRAAIREQLARGEKGGDPLTTS